MSTHCVICPRPVVPRSIYCGRCRPLVATKAESLKRRAALREAYDRARDGFRCHWSSVPLEVEDRGDPFHLCFDHLVPVRSSRLVASSELFNSMKTDLAPEEYPKVVAELARHHDGRPFDRDVVGFVHWSERLPPRMAPEPGPRLRPGERSTPASSECVICGAPPYGRSVYCPTCRRFVFWGGRDHRPRAAALKRAWDPEERCFRCYYTGARLDDSNPRSAWYLNIEHRIPGDEGSIVVAAAWVNAMKTDLAEDEFWAVVVEYDACLREHREFNTGVAEYRYWRRSARRLG